MTEIQQGHPFVFSWQFPWVEGMDINSAASSFRLYTPIMELLELREANGLLIERYTLEEVTVTAPITACLFDLGDVLYDLTVVDGNGDEIFHADGSVTIIPAVEEPVPLEPVTSIKRWNLPPDAQPEADQVTIDARYLLCLACDFYDAAEEVCLECGCTVPTKVRGLNQSCPIGKW